ncbi:reverse transcriptase domain-containing protein [Tanacetum coccineum]
MAYPCLHSLKTNKGIKLDTPYLEDSIRRIQDMYREYDLAHLKLIFEFSIYKVWKSVGYGVSMYWIRRIEDFLEHGYAVSSLMDTAYWSLETYRPRVSVKGQILADFIVERPKEDSPDTPMEVEEELPEPWILFTDGSSCTDGSKAGLILINPEGMKFTYALRFRFDATNNEAEYEALIARLRIAEQMGVKNL